MDPEDPTIIAETELLGAAASIEAAAKKLEQLKPRAKPKVWAPPCAVCVCVCTHSVCKAVFGACACFYNCILRGRFPHNVINLFSFLHCGDHLFWSLKGETHFDKGEKKKSDRNNKKN